MATRKQRRRREKERRHEYEIVYVDEAGEEVEVDEAEVAPKTEPKPARTEARKPAAKQAPADRAIQPPSWERVAKRALLFAPFIIIFLYLLKPKDSSTAVALWPAAVMIVLLVPFMYLVDSFAYKTYVKRQEKRSSAKRK